ncbi:MAG TPA: A/G-specific adenine glycosylase [Isosphaeraceae bacterium]|jgi:A/G-specific adenine glycosylase|nr:A/G-specific adenine glycosylase [Isosphaeraceae bacterium]
MSEVVNPDQDLAWVAEVRQQLVRWYQQGHRDLPWRTTRDAYRILVSETMLIQTTVTAVIPYYDRFLARFPTIRDLAGAEETEVLKAWEGLGYYRRARQLHMAAQVIVRDYGGAVPDELDAVRALPGVGRYIAGAILSFAFDRAAPIVEANTQRVLARWLAWKEDLRSSRSQARLWRAAERLVPPEGAGLFNQAMIELGAVICTPRVPLCLACPVTSECRARGLGLQDALPIKLAKEPPLAVIEACALVVRQGRLLIVRRTADGLWGGFWEFPTVHLGGADPAGRSFGEPIELAEGVRRLTGVRAAIGPAVRTLRFGVTKHRVELSAHAAVGEEGELRAGPGLSEVRWEMPSALSEYPFGSAGRRLALWVTQLGAAGLQQRVRG